MKQLPLDSPLGSHSPVYSCPPNGFTAISCSCTSEGKSKGKLRELRSLFQANIHSRKREGSGQHRDSGSVSEKFPLETQSPRVVLQSPHLSRALTNPSHSLLTPSALLQAEKYTLQPAYRHQDKCALGFMRYWSHHVVPLLLHFYWNLLSGPLELPVSSHLHLKMLGRKGFTWSHPKSHIWI